MRFDLTLGLLLALGASGAWAEGLESGGLTKLNLLASTYPGDSLIRDAIGASSLDVQGEFRLNLDWRIGARVLLALVLGRVQLLLAEVLEHVQWNPSATDKDALADELADVALYLLQLAHIAGIDLEAAILTKLNRNYQRQWDEDNDQS